MSEMTPCKSVAVIDDDESLCRSLVRLLRTSGFQPVCYLSAEEFLVLIEGNIIKTVAESISAPPGATVIEPR